jgi:hypothetical protein
MTLEKLARAVSSGCLGRVGHIVMENFAFGAYGMKLAREGC